MKRLKRASSSLSTHLFLNGQHAEHSDEDDERDSAVEPSSDVTCSTCQMSYPNLAQLIRHGKRKHQIDLSTVNPTLRTLTNGETSESIGTDVQKSRLELSREIEEEIR